MRRRELGLGVAALALILCASCSEPTVTSSAPRPTLTATATAAVTVTPNPSPTTAPTPTFTSRPTSTLQPTSTATPTPTPRPTAPSPESLATQYPELAPMLNNPEVSAAYKELAVAYEQGGQQGVMAAARDRGLLTAEGDIRATLVLDTTDTAGTVTQLQSMGIKVVGTEGDRIQIAIPQSLLMAGANDPGSALNQLSAIEHVVGVEPPN